MKTDVVLGLQWGDEGKGKIVDVLARKYPVVARFQGGPNAGHSLHFEGHSFVLRSVPSGIFREDAINIVGNGVVLDPITKDRRPCKRQDSGGQESPSHTSDTPASGCSQRGGHGEGENRLHTQGNRPYIY